MTKSFGENAESGLLGPLLLYFQKGSENELYVHFFTEENFYRSKPGVQIRKYTTTPFPSILFLKMLFVLQVHPADSNLSRVDLSTLPDETLMDLLIDGIQHPEHITEKNGKPLHFSEWNGVDLDESGHVGVIDWTF